MSVSNEKLKYGADVGDLGIDMVRAVCAELLAVREAQSVPVAVLDIQRSRDDKPFLLIENAAARELPDDTYQLFTSQPVLMVPSKKDIFDIIRRYSPSTTHFDTGWMHVAADACRTTMLQPVSQGYTLPKGYKLVPAEPTAEMIAATEIDGDEYYFESDKAAETWMANKFKAMLAAAPTPTK